MNPAILSSEAKTNNPKKILIFSVLVLLGLNFTLAYIAHTYYSETLLQVQGPGFWIGISTFTFMTAIVLWNKKIMGWTWSELGLGKPANWWQPLLIAGGLFVTMNLFMKYAAPYIVQLGERPSIEHLLEIPGNLPMLIVSLVLVWITAAFLEELIFRAYLINVLDRLLGKTRTSAWAAVIVSAVIFGLLHAYQGLTGILLTGSFGLIAGIFFLLNGRRIWPLILIHGLIDTISFIHIYNM